MSEADVLDPQSTEIAAKLSELESLARDEELKAIAGIEIRSESRTKVKLRDVDANASAADVTVAQTNGLLEPQKSGVQIDPRKNEAYAAYRSCEVARAIELYSTLLNDKGEDVAVLSCRSACYLRTGDLVQVEEDVDAALGIADADIPSRLRLKLLPLPPRRRRCSAAAAPPPPHRRRRTAAAAIALLQLHSSCRTAVAAAAAPQPQP